MEFERKRHKIEKLHKDREIQEIKNVEVSLKRYQDKLHEGEIKHSQQIKRVISEAKLRNSMQSEKVDRWKEEKTRLEQQEMFRLYLNEEKYKKKMDRIYKSTQDLQEKIREKKMMKLEKQGANKHLED